MDAAGIETLISPIVEQESAEIVDVRFAKEGPKWVLRVFVDKAGGITLDDCAYLSERIGGAIDAAKAIDRSYVLEVSSPGLDRVIKKERDFQRFAGKAVKVRLRLAEQGQRHFKGTLVGWRDGKVVVDVEGSERAFEASNVEEARLDYSADIDFGGRHGKV